MSNKHCMCCTLEEFCKEVADTKGCCDMKWRYGEIGEWFRKRKIVSLYLHQEREKSYEKDMIKWEKSNPKPKPKPKPKGEKRRKNGKK